MTRFILVALAGLAGCAPIPADLRDNGIPFQRSSALGPAAAAHCVTRNAEMLSSSAVDSRWNPDLSRVMIVTVRPDPSLPVQTVAAARVQSSGTGSTVEIWLKPGVYAAPDKFVNQLASGC